MLFGRILPLERGVAALRTWVEARGAVGMVGFGLAYTTAALAFVPGALLSLMAGAVFGPLWGVVVVTFAALAADVAAFLTARYIARARVAELARRYPKFGAIDQAIRAGGWKIVALLRLSPIVPYSASNYLYGLTGVGLLPYTVASAIFSFPGTVAYVWLGYLGTETVGGAERTPAEWTLLTVGIGATVAATVYITRLARRALAQQGTFET